MNIETKPFHSASKALNEREIQREHVRDWKQSSNRNTTITGREKKIACNIRNVTTTLGLTFI